MDLYTVIVVSGQEVFIDADIWEWAIHQSWHLSNGYAACSLMGRSTYLHRIIMEHPIGHVHHRNENPFDCRRSNLQVLAPGEHKRIHGGITGPRGPQEPRTVPNRTVHPPKGRSGYKGVTWNSTMKRWYAKATMDKKTHFLGFHDTPEEAAIVYDAFVLAYRPKGSFLNLLTGP